MVKAIGLLSGGLDSILAVKVIIELGIEVQTLNFVTPFCTCTKKGCQNQARLVAERFSVPLKTVGFSGEYIELVKHPRFGYGRNMNPCIDCRIFMFSKARDYMNEVGASFVFTGEVLGERPMSQMRDTLRIIEKESGLEGRLLRPLSAKLLPPTVPEQQGIVDREKLLSISGRSRKPQIALAREFEISDYPCPAGGCKLTDPQYARRLREALEHNEDSLAEIQLLSIGRHFRLISGAKAIVGRNEEENTLLKTFSRDGDVILEVIGFVGPVTLVRKKQEFFPDDINTAAGLCVRFSDYKNPEPVAVSVGGNDIMLVTPLVDELVEKLRIR
jgi:tRNA U34 2-thiouridine synthase MnmA/TrmU